MPDDNARPVPTDVLDQIRDIVGDKGVLTDRQAIDPYCRAWRDDWHGDVPMVVRPATTDEVARVVRACAAAKVAIVPQGGNTGLTGAGQPHEGGWEIILSLGRMNRIREVDALNDTMTVEAGCILQTVQQAAAEADRLFPLSLAAEGSCAIGGNLATNAGGTQVVRYGNAKNLVLGLEAVLADGQVLSSLSGLRKDNAGYDLKQLFLGTEGTLGIITAATLKLVARPTDTISAFLAVPTVQASVELLAAAKAHFGEVVTRFELMQRICVEIAARHIGGVTDPLESQSPWYVLLELAGQGAPGTLRAGLEAWLAAAMDAGQVTDGALGESEAQASAFWHMRESLAEAQNAEGASIKHDVSVPVSKVPDFIARAEAALTDAYDGIRPLAFGHLGDGNIHFNPHQPVGQDPAAFKAERARINRMVHDIVVDMGGSISAEHGIGQLRREELAHYKSPVALDLMRRLKRALDPDNILNPGKVIDL